MIEVRQCDAGHLSLDAANWECPWCEVERLRTEMHDCSDRDTRAFASLQAQAHRHEAEVERLTTTVAHLSKRASEYEDDRDRNAALCMDAVADANRLRDLILWCESDDSEEGHAWDALMDEARKIRAALRGGGERCLCDDDSPNHCAKCTRELLCIGALDLAHWLVTAKQKRLDRPSISRHNTVRI